MTDENISEEELFMSDDQVETPADQSAEEVAEPVEQPPAEPEAAEPVVEAAAETPPEEIQEPVEQANPNENEASVPSWRLREVNEAKASTEAELLAEREKAAQLQAQLQALQQTQQQQTQTEQPVPDMYENPEGFIAYQNQQIAQVQRQNQLNNARMEAMVLHGAQEVQDAWNEAIKVEHTDPAVASRISNSPNPWAEAVKWHKEQQVQAAIGEGGIDAFTERQRQELMQDPEFRKQVFEEMKAEVGVSTPKPVESIPSLNGQPSVAVAPTGEDRIPSEEELFLAV